MIKIMLIVFAITLSGQVGFAATGGKNTGGTSYQEDKAPPAPPVQPCGKWSSILTYPALFTTSDGFQHIQKPLTIDFDACQYRIIYTQNGKKDSFRIAMMANAQVDKFGPTMLRQILGFSLADAFPVISDQVFDPAEKPKATFVELRFITNYLNDGKLFDQGLIGIESFRSGVRQSIGFKGANVLYFAAEHREVPIREGYKVILQSNCGCVR